MSKNNNIIDVKEIIKKRISLRVADWTEHGIEIQYEADNGDKIPVSLSDYMDKEIRARIVDSKEIIIKDEVITILFNSSPKKTITATIENKGGFSRLDLLKYIYAGYRKHLLSINPNNNLELMKHYIIEKLIYDSELKVVFLSVVQ